jgi:hypothetical protein
MRTADVSNPTITLRRQVICRLKTDRLIVASHKWEPRKPTIHKDSRDSKVRKSPFPIPGPRAVRGSNEKTIDAS